MTQEDKDYLVWRCKTNWHNKYYRYIGEWINSVLPIQLEYFKKEKENLIKRGVYIQSQNYGYLGVCCI